MRVTLNITAPEGEFEELDLLSLEILPETSLALLKETIQAETTIPATSQHLYHNGRLLSDESKTMEQLDIGDGEMLALHVRDIAGYTGVPTGQAAPQTQRAAPSAGSGAGGSAGLDPETLRLQILGNPHLRQQMMSQRPDLAQTLESPHQFAQALRSAQDAEINERRERHLQISRLNADPFDVEAQQRIEEMIRQERVQENLQNAIEHNPEVFGRVHMLYIDTEVNGHKVKAFVDSGAQATIMSPSCAEACGIMRLVDKRFSGVARGVGTAAILGRVHSAQIKIGSLFLACSFTVMEGKDVDLLLGLDMLKRHQACIDLAADKLIIQGQQVPFLGEADIPKGLEEARIQEPTVAGPGGTTIGARSGAVSAPQQPDSSSGAGQSSASPAPAPGPAQAPALPPRQQAPSFPEEKVEQLMALGFSKEEAVQALVATGGNVEYAAGLLFQN